MSREGDVATRDVEPGDEAFLRRLFESVRHEDFALLPLAGEQRKALIDMQFRAQRASYDAQFPDARRELLLIDAEPAGCLTWSESDDAVHLIDISILPELQNRGTGTAVCKRLIAIAAKADLPVILHVSHLNPARRLYERLGFQAEGESGMHVRMVWHRA